MFSTRRNLKTANPKFKTPKPNWSLDPAAQMPQSPQFSTATTKITTAFIRSVNPHQFFLSQTPRIHVYAF